MTSPTPKAALSVLLLTSALLLPGCLKARETDRILYDPTPDQFRLVMVLENITGTNSDLQYLAAITQNKDHLLAPLMPGNFMGYAPWYIRLADHKAAKVTFSQPRPGDLQPIEATTPLSAIDIRPGTFFIQNNGLCYYHALAVPGKTIDALLAQTQKDQFKPFQKAVQKEIDRRKNGGRTYTWDELIAQEIKALNENSTKHPIQPQQVVEEESLNLLIKAAADNKTALVRKGKDFQLALPLTLRDREGLATLWTTWQKAADADAQKKPDNPMLSLQRLPAQHIALTTTDTGILLSIDIVALYNTFAATFLDFMNSRTGPAETPKELTAEVRYAQSHNWLTPDPLSSDQILKAFADNTLKAHPSPTPVPPGTNLKPQPK
jgi:hypothetical protein